MKKFLILGLALVMFAGCTDENTSKTNEANAQTNNSNTEVADNQKEPETDLEKFAACLGENDAVLYVSRTCPHCTNQKNMFGEALTFLTYYDCLDEKGGQECNKAQVQAVPTWIFEDGSKLMGTQTFEALAEKTGCIAPQS